MNPNAAISAVIPTRGKPELLANLLRSLSAYAPDIQVIVVEHETEECEEIVRETFPQAVYHKAKNTEAPEDRREHGLSYSDLNNIGAQYATGDVLWLLNDDVVVKRETAAKMLAVLQEKPDVGIVGCKLLKLDSTIQHIGVIFDSFGVPYHLGHGEKNARTFLPAWRSEYFDAATFACVMVRRSVWNLLEGLDADYFFNYEDVDFCLRAKERGIRTFVTQEAVALHIEGASSDVRATERHSRKRNLIIFRDKWINSGRLEKITDIRLQRGAGPLAVENMNVVMVPAGPGVGIAWWRMDLVARKIAQKKLANVQMVYPASMQEQELNEVLSRADIAVFQAWFAEGILELAKLGAERSFKMVYEYDDHPIYLSPFAQAYRGLGTREQKLQSKDGEEVWLWRDGEAGFDLQRNRECRQRQLEIMHHCDAITTTTEPLAAYFRTLNPLVHVLPNCIDFDYYPPMYDLFARREGPVRIGWWGGDNHWHDVSIVGPWLSRYVNTHDARLVVLGAFYKGPLRDADRSKIEEHTWQHVEAFPYKLATAALDVVIIPLAPPHMPEMKFNEFKSNIKFLEAAAYKLPCLVQADVAPYLCCVDGVNALTYATEEEFYAKLDELCRDPELRRRLGEAAYDFVREHHDLDREIERWLEAYDSIIKGPERAAGAAHLAGLIAGMDDDGLRPAGSNAAAEDVSRAS